MPIRIPDDLPARKTLEEEGVNVMDSSRAARQDIRPLEFGLLNLMPNKERTETQFARLIGATPLQINLSLVRVTDHQSKNTPEDYLNTFYQTWEEVKERKFDGFIVTGAPIANMPFEEVRYWPEMLEIMGWTRTNVHHTMFICWGAQAALHHFHGARRYRMDKKAFGVFRHKVTGPRSPFLRRPQAHAVFLGLHLVGPQVHGNPAPALGGTQNGHGFLCLDFLVLGHATRDTVQHALQYLFVTLLLLVHGDSCMICEPR